MTQVDAVEHGVVVRLAYRLEIGDELVESTEDDGPIEFLQGYAEILPGLEQALYGLRLGDEKQIVIEPEDGFGQYRDEAYEEVPLEIFPEDVDLGLGMPVELHDEETGDSVEGFISEIRQETVVVDMNHPLAGETLRFDVEVVGLRSATEEELSHGHAHGADGDGPDTPE